MNFVAPIGYNAGEVVTMDTNETWKIGRRFGDGLWLASCLEDAVQSMWGMCAEAGYRIRDVCVWRDGTQSDDFVVGMPGGQGGFAASSLKEAAELRERVARSGMGGLVIRERCGGRLVTRREARDAGVI